jgi:superfamily I DNA/RNA helicase
VFVLNTVDGCIPSDLATGTTAEIEEERRLLYVAITRAKDPGLGAGQIRKSLMAGARSCHPPEL